MAVCWRTRGCEEDMQATCAHTMSDFDMCPSKCDFSNCDRPTYELTIDPELIFDPSVDRSVAIKQNCIYCKFFLTNAPRVVKEEKAQ